MFATRRVLDIVSAFLFVQFAAVPRIKPLTSIVTRR